MSKKKKQNKKIRDSYPTKTLKELEDEILKKKKIKKYIYNSELIKKIELLRVKYDGLKKENLNVVSKSELEIINLYRYLWQVNIDDLFIDDYSHESSILSLLIL